MEELENYTLQERTELALSNVLVSKQNMELAYNLYVDCRKHLHKREQEYMAMQNLVDKSEKLEEVFDVVTQ